MEKAWKFLSFFEFCSEKKTQIIRKNGREIKDRKKTFNLELQSEFYDRKQQQTVIMKTLKTQTQQ